jgi:glucokinase-like ROK family protein
MRKLNKDAVLELVRQAGPMSRADLARHTLLSPSTISAITLELIEAQWVRETGAGLSRGGRRPVLLEFNREAALVVGVEMGVTHLTILVTNLAPDILVRYEVPFNVAVHPEVGIERLIEGIRAALGQLRINNGGSPRVASIGIGVPGPVDVAQGALVAPPLIPQWDGFPLSDELNERLGLQVLIDNDATLGVLGEYTFGAGQDVDALAYVKLGTGIGCGLICNGELYRGARGYAGEIGHLMVAQNGPPCRCGSYGCLEAMAGGEAVAQQAKLALKAGHRSILSNIADPDTITAREVAAAAAAGDALGRQILNTAGRLLGIALADLVNLLNPGRIVIGGGLVQAGEPLLAPLRDTVRAQAMRASGRATDIVPAALGGDSIALGAVAMVLKTILYGAAIPNRVSSAAGLMVTTHPTWGTQMVGVAAN